MDVRFVLIDRLVELEPGRRAAAAVRFSPADDVFADHFPGRPIVPGVLLTEAMGQTGGWLVAATLGFARWPLLVLIEHAKFRRPVEPGEDVDITATITSAREDIYGIDAVARISADKVASARLVLQAMAFALPPVEEQQFSAWAHATYTRLGGARLHAPPAPRR